YDNEAYMNTGIQRSSATPFGSWTNSTPAEALEARPKKDIVAIMAAHGIPYTATATVAFPDDMIRKIQRARSIRGPKFLHVLSPCPPGWKAEENLGVTISRMAVETHVFPLYEVEDGRRVTINHWPKGLPVERYTSLQGRFRHLNEEDLATIQRNVDRGWARLVARVAEPEVTAPTLGSPEEIAARAAH
ncbi:MAG: hypothetical protein KC466_03190, partial [Myxococcales bacterium]|nr:hypothetical protein [Myxococcales bacterium]